MLRLNDLMAVCVLNLPLVILPILSLLGNESENENKINQNSSVYIPIHPLVRDCPSPPACKQKTSENSFIIYVHRNSVNSKFCTDPA